jgi:hypothetical protein
MGNIFLQLSSDYTTVSGTAADALLRTRMATIERIKRELPVSSDNVEDI